MTDIIAKLRNFRVTGQTETQPNADFYKLLKRLSQEGSPSGEDVELSDQGPFTIFGDRSPSSAPEPLSKEQLGNILNDFQDQLAASKPPAPSTAPDDAENDLSK